jgi:Cysteine-rich secretory protein family
LSTESGVSNDERRLILEEHNYLRQTVATGHVTGQPAAQNMQEMQWDDELAAKAQQWANECTFQHDPSRYLGEFKRRDDRKVEHFLIFH